MPSPEIQQKINAYVQSLTTQKEDERQQTLRVNNVAVIRQVVPHEEEPQRRKILSL